MSKLRFWKVVAWIISYSSFWLWFFVPTGSAFYQQCSKRSVSAFRHFLREFNLKFNYLDPDDISDEYLLKFRIVRFQVVHGIFENKKITLTGEQKNGMLNVLSGIYQDSNSGIR